jgi:hypothetical protein
MVNGNGNGKRLLLIALVVLGGFWLANDAYRDGYYDALVQTGQISRVHDYDGPHFPWGLLIIGGIAFIAWRKGAFDRFGGPGGPFGSFPGDRGGQQYGPGSAPMFRGPRAYFDEWHRQAHAAHRNVAAAPAAPHAPQAPVTPPAPPAPPTSGGNGMPQAAPGAPAPTPPTADYWATMPRSPEAPPAAAPNTSSSAAPEQPRPAEQQPGHVDGTAGPVLERW